MSLHDVDFQTISEAVELLLESPSTIRQEGGDQPIPRHPFSPAAPLEEQAGEEGEDVLVAEALEQRLEGDRAPRHRLIGWRARELNRRVAHVVQHLWPRRRRRTATNKVEHVGTRLRFMPRRRRAP